MTQSQISFGIQGDLKITQNLSDMLNMIEGENMGCNGQYKYPICRSVNSAPGGHEIANCNIGES